MLTTFWKVLAGVWGIVPTLVSDVEGSITKIKADTTIPQKVEDVLNAALVAVEAISKAIL